MFAHSLDDRTPGTSLPLNKRSNGPGRARGGRPLSAVIVRLRRRLGTSSRPLELIVRRHNKMRMSILVNLRSGKPRTRL